MSPTQVALLFLACVLVVSGALAVAARVREASSTEKRCAAAIAFALIVIAIVRALVTTPSFIHANFHAGALVEATLAFPVQSSFRSTYGAFGYLALGGITRLFGSTFEVMARANAIFSVALLGAMAWTAYRYARSFAAAMTTLALGAFHVAIVRVGASEDVHTLAALLGFVALLGMDMYAERRCRSALVMATVALVLMIHTRQTLYLFVPFAFAMAFARAGKGILGEWAFRIALLAIAAGLVWRLAAALGDASERTTLTVVATIFISPRVLFEAFVRNPLVDLIRFGPAVPILFVVGLIGAFRRRGVLRAFAIVSLVGFIFCLPFAWHTSGVEWSFRTPSTTLGLVLGGIGGAFVMDRVRAPWMHAIVVASIALVPACLPNFRALREKTTDFQEYEFVRGALGSLPKHFALAGFHTTPFAPAYHPPIALFLRNDIDARLVDDASAPSDWDEDPQLFLVGAWCYGWSFSEASGLMQDPSRTTRAQLARWAPIVISGDRSDPDLRVPLGMRPECAALVHDATPIGPRGEIVDPPDDMPFVLYAERRIPLQFYRRGTR